MTNQNDEQIESIIRKLASKRHAVIRVAAESLLKFDVSDMEKLIPYLKYNNYYVRRIVADNLGRTKCEKAVEPLINLLKDKHIGVRYSAAKALGEIKDKKAIQPLHDLLIDADISVCIAAIESLSELGDQSRLPILVNILHENQQNIYIRNIASEAIQRIMQK